MNTFQRRYTKRLVSSALGARIAAMEVEDREKGGGESASPPPSTTPPPPPPLLPPLPAPLPPPPRITYRPLDARCLPDLRALNSALFPISYGPRVYEQALAAGGISHGAVFDGEELVGAITVRLEAGTAASATAAPAASLFVGEDGGGEGNNDGEGLDGGLARMYVMTVGVLSPWRGKGIGEWSVLVFWGVERERVERRGGVGGCCAVGGSLRAARVLLFLSLSLSRFLSLIYSFQLQKKTKNGKAWGGEIEGRERERDCRREIEFERARVFFISLTFFFPSTFSKQKKTNQPNPPLLLPSSRNDPPRQRPLDGRRRRRRRRGLPARARGERRGARLLPRKARVPARGDGEGVLQEADAPGRGRAVEEAEVDGERRGRGGVVEGSPLLFLAQNCKKKNEKRKRVFFVSFSLSSLFFVSFRKKEKTPIAALFRALGEHRILLFFSFSIRLRRQFEIKIPARGSEFALIPENRR